MSDENQVSLESEGVQQETESQPEVNEPVVEEQSESTQPEEEVELSDNGETGKIHLGKLRKSAEGRGFKKGFTEGYEEAKAALIQQSQSQVQQHVEQPSEMIQNTVPPQQTQQNYVDPNILATERMGRQKYDNWDTVVNNAITENQAFPQMMDAMRSALHDENGEDIIYELATNAKYAKDLARCKNAQEVAYKVKDISDHLGKSKMATQPKQTANKPAYQPSTPSASNSSTEPSFEAAKARAKRWIT